MTTPSSAGLGLTSATIQGHETRATPGSAQKYSVCRGLKQTTVHLPVELETKLRMRAVEGGTSRQELMRTVLEHWLGRHASEPEKLLRDKIRLLAVQDGRKPGVVRGETRLVCIYLAAKTHAQIKQLAEVTGRTMRGIIIGIMQVWVLDNCE